MKKFLLRYSFAACAIACVFPALAASNWKEFSTPGGQEAVPLALTDLAGRTVDLAAFKGEVVLVNFWATWCEPCRDEMPSLDRLYQELRGRRLRVLGINVGEGKARIGQFLDRVPVSFTIVRDADSEAMKSWRVRVLPASFLVDSKGMLRYQLVGDADWGDPKIREPILKLLKESRSWSSSSSAQKNTSKPYGMN